MNFTHFAYHINVYVLTSGEVFGIKCMDPQCKYLFTVEILRELVPEELMQKYERFFINKVVEVLCCFQAIFSSAFVADMISCSCDDSTAFNKIIDFFVT